MQTLIDFRSHGNTKRADINQAENVLDIAIAYDPAIQRSPVPT